MLYSSLENIVVFLVDTYVSVNLKKWSFCEIAAQWPLRVSCGIFSKSTHREWITYVSTLGLI